MTVFCGIISYSSYVVGAINSLYRRILVYSYFELNFYFPILATEFRRHLLNYVLLFYLKRVFWRNIRWQFSIARNSNKKLANKKFCIWYNFCGTTHHLQICQQSFKDNWCFSFFFDLLLLKQNIRLPRIPIYRINLHVNVPNTTRVWYQEWTKNYFRVIMRI